MLLKQEKDSFTLYNYQILDNKVKITKEDFNLK